MKMRFFSRLSIRTKINVGITLVILIFGLVSTVMVVRITSRALLEEIKKRGASLTLNLAARTTEPLLAQDFLRLKDVVDESKPPARIFFMPSCWIKMVRSCPILLKLASRWL